MAAIGKVQSAVLLIFSLRRKWILKKYNKKADYTDIKNRRERGSRFKMMFYVIGFEIQRRVLSQCLLLPTKPKAYGATRYFWCTDTVSGNPDQLFLNMVEHFIQLSATGDLLRHNYTKFF